jgi:hypothetical protein
MYVYNCCRNLVSHLQNFPEKIVAEQLGKLLLSRMVLLNATAQAKFLPFILKPKGTRVKLEYLINDILLAI